jgi:hypothetical protein
MKRTKEVRADSEPSDEKIMAIVRKAMEDYRGDASILEGAIGALLWGRHVGWQGIRLMHAFYTIQRYERILGVKFRDVLPERTDKSRRMNGVRLADAFERFWQAVSSGTITTRKAAIVGEAE